MADSKSNPLDHDDDQLDALITGYFEAELSNEQMTILNDRLRNDALGRQRFVAIAMTLQACAASERMAREKVIEDELATLSVMGMTVESTEPGQIETDPSLRALAALEPPQRTESATPRKWPAVLRPTTWMRQAPLRSLAAAILIVVSAAGVLLWRQFGPAAHSVATLTRMVDATWDGQAQKLGARLAAQTRLSLTSGYAELTFSTGATVVVEAPAEFTLGSAGAMSLLSGKLSATVPPPAHGFTVTTPSASVTDLGTEFGVQVADADQTRVEVFVGTVYALGINNANGDTRPATPAQLLSAGQAADVSSTAVTLDPAGASPQRFVRSLGENLTALDLVDLFTGGDGSAPGLHGTGIDQSTGDFGSIAGPTRSADTSYHRVLGRPVVDGCFVPNGRKGPMSVDSADDRFRFPVTSGITDYSIWAGIPKAIKGKQISPRLGSVDYSLPDHDLIFIHSNGGVTFDLNAIRALHPGLKITRFRCAAGDSANTQNRADVYIMINGASRFERRKIGAATGPLTADVPISATDRFLTLAVTDGGDGIESDWVLFGDPTLELTPR